MQAVQRDIRGSSPNTGREVLPLPSVNSLSVDVVSLAAHRARFLVGKVDGGKIVEEVYPVEGVELDCAHGCRGAREWWSTSLEAAGAKSIHHRGHGEVDPGLARHRCPTSTTFRMGSLQKVVVIGGNGFVGMFARFLQR